MYPIKLEIGGGEMKEIDGAKTQEKPYQTLLSKEAYRSLFNNHPDIVLILGADGVIREINRISLGYELADLKKSFFAFIHPDETEKALTYVEQSFEGETTNFQLTLLHKNGTDVYCEVTLIPININGQINGLYGIIKDISKLKIQEELVKKIESNLNAAQRIARIGSWDYDVIENEAFWSKQMYHIIGIDFLDDFVPSIETVVEFVHPDDKEVVLKKVTDAIRTGQSYENIYRIIVRNNEVRYILETIDAILDENKKTIRLIGTWQDITEKKEAELRLEESQIQFQTIADNLDVSIWSVEMKTNKVVFASKGLETMYGVEREEFYNNPFFWKRFIHPDDLPKVEKKQLELFEGKIISHEYRLIDANGGIKSILDTTIPVFNLNGELVRLDGIMKDISEQKRQAAKYEHMANHDYLTGLANRRYYEMKFRELLKEAKASNQKFAVFYLDLDRFNHINDTYGHEAGDQLLQLVSKRLKEQLGKSDVLARMGGDEFTFYLRDITSIEESTEIARKIIHAFERPFTIGGYKIYVSTSIGISHYPEDGEDIHDLLKRADYALYEAKKVGRNNWQVFTCQMENKKHKNQQLDSELRKALENNELFIEYQPKVDMRDVRIVGAEALVRWHHPIHGRMSPAEFIPVAEEFGLSVQIGEWVIRNVCRQFKKWKSDGIPVVPVSVNISPNSIFLPNFVKKTLEIFEEEGVEPSLFEFEFTEQSIILGEANTIKIIRELKDAGIKIALDDFGTGYSSLRYLKDYDIDCLKIDKSFIDKMINDRKSEAILKGLLSMANDMGIAIVAEGVETTSQLDFLVKRNCNYIQGYIFSGPVRSDEFCKMLQSPLFSYKN